MNFLRGGMMPMMVGEACGAVRQPAVSWPRRHSALRPLSMLSLRLRA
jgi:hypothetical protein